MAISNTLPVRDLYENVLPEIFEYIRSATDEKTSFAAEIIFSYSNNTQETFFFKHEQYGTLEPSTENKVKYSIDISNLPLSPVDINEIYNSKMHINGTEEARVCIKLSHSHNLVDKTLAITNEVRKSIANSLLSQKIVRVSEPEEAEPELKIAESDSADSYCAMM